AIAHKSKKSPRRPIFPVLRPRSSGYSRGDPAHEVPSRQPRQPLIFHLFLRPVAKIFANLENAFGFWIASTFALP
ncbi:MAG: hypothetical protein ACRD5K_15675, partial [Candidatus Acidiferrales bacterium]